MKNYLEYINLILTKKLNLSKNDKSVVVVLPDDYSRLAEYIIPLVKSFNIKDVKICNEDSLLDEGILKEAITSDSKLLLFTDDSKNARYIELLDDLTSYGVISNITIAALPNAFLSEDELMAYSMIGGSKRTDINWNIEASSSNKLANQIKCYDIDYFKLSDYYFTDLKFRIDRSFRPMKKSRIMFPDYSTLITAKQDTCNGYYEAQYPTFVGDERVDDLRLYFKNGYLADFDCSKGTPKVSRALSKSCDVTLVGMGLLNPTTPVIEDCSARNNYVLDRVSHPYLLLQSEHRLDQDVKLIYVPLASGSLKVVGYTKENKPYTILDHGEYTKKMM